MAKGGVIASANSKACPRNLTFNVGLIFGYDIGISGGVTSMTSFLNKFFPETTLDLEFCGENVDIIASLIKLFPIHGGLLERLNFHAPSRYDKHVEGAVWHYKKLLISSVSMYASIAEVKCIGFWFKEAANDRRRGGVGGFGMVEDERERTTGLLIPMRSAVLRQLPPRSSSHCSSLPVSPSN
ncbi:hypothetical protein L6452_15851 [Arctium lappa]|uniref:Uncharacterized protein n=1 Tax=Arctium lappa TaxID=4217 RepID=A0ACB9CPT4_ARCLA|nr:hypothetical protein L6452_15851 [Arctium lappa]